mmetsp:Transcript_124205/g.362525  ORF Transcript_124205/g.362525 Transcript_124205/m.362525 type:complete len:228 (-) Transcript_124205:314-997(-)
MLPEVGPHGATRQELPDGRGALGVEVAGEDHGRAGGLQAQAPALLGHRLQRLLGLPQPPVRAPARGEVGVHREDHAPVVGPALPPQGHDEDAVLVKRAGQLPEILLPEGGRPHSPLLLMHQALVAKLCGQEAKVAFERKVRDLLEADDVGQSLLELALHQRLPCGPWRVAALLAVVLVDPPAVLTVGQQDVVAHHCEHIVCRLWQWLFRCKPTCSGGRGAWGEDDGL